MACKLPYRLPLHRRNRMVSMRSRFAHSCRYRHRHITLILFFQVRNYLHARPENVFNLSDQVIGWFIIFSRAARRDLPSQHIYMAYGSSVTSTFMLAPKSWSKISNSLTLTMFVTMDTVSSSVQHFFGWDIIINKNKEVYGARSGSLSFYALYTSSSQSLQVNGDQMWHVTSAMKPWHCNFMRSILISSDRNKVSLSLVSQKYSISEFRLTEKSISKFRLTERKYVQILCFAWTVSRHTSFCQKKSSEYQDFKYDLLLITQLLLEITLWYLHST